MKCVNHFDKDAVGVCNHCGKSICTECQYSLNNENYCKDCLAIKQGQVQKKETRSPALAAILSFIIGGLGQFYNGQPGKGVLIFLTSWLVIPWIIGIIDAYNVAVRINNGEVNLKKNTGCLIAFIVSVIVIWMTVFVIILLALIAIPNLLRARTVANDSAAEATLKSISTAFESYAVGHNGVYPGSESELTDARPAYLFQTYNNRSVNGYTYSEQLRPDGYAITATPNRCGTSGTKVLMIEKNGVLTSSACAEAAGK